jgi:hypothetical protein
MEIRIMAISLKSLGGSSGGNGFSLLVGSSGNTTFTFDTDQPAGAYTITSELGDTSFDVYCVTASNENAGYTNNLSLETSADFNRVVLYGGTANDVLSFVNKPSKAPATKGDVVDGAAPFLTSATPTTLASVDDTTTVTGGNFAADVGISFVGQDTIVVPAKSVVRSSSTELIVTRPDAFLVAQEPFSMTATNAGITNPSVVVNKLTDYFDAGSGLVWVTTSPLAEFTTDSAYSETLEATDVDGGAITYAVTTGSLPTGLSLNSATGVVSGTPTGTSDEIFTVTATDASGNSSPREFLLQKLTTFDVDYLVIAGGGGGGRGHGAGGGAGGYLTTSGVSRQLSTSYPIKVGAGGTAQNNGPGTVGSISAFASDELNGGGGGGNLGVAGGSGGSGGGGGANDNAGGGVGGTAINSGSQGNNGGGGSSTQYGGSGGGGGAGGQGNGVTSGHAGANGGAGLTSSITGSAVTRAGGGGGGGGNASSGAPAGAGGTGGGGTGGTGMGNGTAGTTNTGGGGGGGAGRTGVGNSFGANGGSGIVILKYPDSYTATFSGGVTHDTPDPSPVSGYKITTITATSTTSETVSFA